MPNFVFHNVLQKKKCLCLNLVRKTQFSPEDLYKNKPPPPKPQQPNRAILCILRKEILCSFVASAKIQKHNYSHLMSLVQGSGCTRCPLVGCWPSVFPAKIHEVQSTPEPGRYATDAPHTHLCSYHCATHQEWTNIGTYDKGRCVVKNSTFLMLQLQLSTLYRGQTTFKGSDIIHFSEMVKYYFSAESSV